MQFDPKVRGSFPEFLEALEKLTFSDRRGDLSQEPVGEFLDNNAALIQGHVADPRLQFDLKVLSDRVAQAVSAKITPLLQPEPEVFDPHAIMGTNPYPCGNWTSLSQSEKVQYINANETPIANLVDYKTPDSVTQFLVQNPAVSFLDLRGYELTDQQLQAIIQNRPTLSTLCCDSSQITGNGLDFSQCGQLQSLMLQCPSLTRVPVLDACPIRELDLSTCCMSQVDMSGLSGLESAEIKNCPSLAKVIVPAGSTLQVLDVGGCSSLSVVQNLSALTGLVGLGLHNCILMKKLDLSQLTTLQALHVGGIQFEEFSGLDALAHLTEINREGSSLDSELLKLQTRANVI